MASTMFGSPQNLRVLLADVSSVDRHGVAAAEARRVLPFITISREPGIDAAALGNAVVDALNEAEDDAYHRLGRPKPPQPWTGWDREGLQRVCRDAGLNREAVASLEESNRSWLGDFFAGLSSQNNVGGTDQDVVFRHIAEAVMALAEMGRTVIVGCGAALLTRNLRGGVHVRLVAPDDYRVARVAAEMRSTTDVATRHLRELDRNRDGFFRRYWPREPLRPDHFALTINVREVPTDIAVETIVKLVNRAGRGQG